ncbi:MAG: hypothetical protein P4L53_06220 [Candidatus Obscuribacterales bacterium]|nr:hypothetical protein [Candidatus Obscuribacterales bacterium]
MSVDLSTVDSVVDALYRGISFSPGVGPDYELIRTLFHPQGIVTAPKEDTAGSITPVAVDQFLIRFDDSLKAEGLLDVGASEQELSRKTLIFRRIAHVFSIYEFTLLGADAPIARGMNTLQLVHDFDRWWILSLSWDRARPGEPLTVHSFETPGAEKT